MESMECIIICKPNAQKTGQSSSPSFTVSFIILAVWAASVKPAAKHHATKYKIAKNKMKGPQALKPIPLHPVFEMDALPLVTSI